MCSGQMSIMVSILLYQFEPESDPSMKRVKKNFPKHGCYKTFLNGNFFFILVILFYSILLLSYKNFDTLLVSKGW